jgi:hypothetical protein
LTSTKIGTKATFSPPFRSLCVRGVGKGLPKKML